MGWKFNRWLSTANDSAPKRGTAAHVGDRVEAFLAHASTRDVDAVPGHEFFVTAQVDGGNCVFRSVSSPPARSGEHAERMPQQVPGAADPSLAQKFAHLAAGDGLPAQLHLGIDFDLEAHLASELGEHLHISRGFVAEMKVVAFVHFAGVQLFLAGSLRQTAAESSAKGRARKAGAALRPGRWPRAGAVFPEWA